MAPGLTNNEDWCCKARTFLFNSDCRHCHRCHGTSAGPFFLGGSVCSWQADSGGDMQGQWSKFSSGVKPTKIAQSQWDKAEAFRAKLNKDLIDLENSLQVSRSCLLVTVRAVPVVHKSVARKGKSRRSKGCPKEAIPSYSTAQPAAGTVPS